MEKFEKVSEIITKIKPGFIAGTSAVGTYVCSHMGGFDKLLQTLLFFMLADILLGLSIAIVRKNSPKSLSGKVDSTPLFVGLVKKFVVLVLVAIAFKIDLALELEYIRNITVFAFLAQEGLSIVENAVLLGVKVPDPVRNGLEILDKKNKQ